MKKLISYQLEGAWGNNYYSIHAVQAQDGDSIRWIYYIWREDWSDVGGPESGPRMAKELNFVGEHTPHANNQSDQPGDAQAVLADWAYWVQMEIDHPHMFEMEEN